MKSILLSFLLLSTAFAFGQKDSAKRDTAYVYVMDDPKLDTVRVTTLMYKGPNHTVAWTSPGYYVLKFQIGTFDGGKTWSRANQQPTILFALDDKKRRIEPIK